MKHSDENFQTTMAFYSELRTEIKVRAISILSFTRDNSVPAQIVYESSYLQLRMICELIAIACLVVHGDIPATKSRKMMYTWQADKIINRLSEIHGDFYPRPVQAQANDKFKIDPVTEGFLTKADLVLLCNKCGDRLHRGTVKNVRYRVNPQNVTFDQIKMWHEKIVRLLQHHWIKVFGSNDQIGVQMNEVGKPVSWNYWAVLE
jgi:hypothetical protein